MSGRRFFVQGDLQKDKVVLSGEEHRHIAKVLRLREGECVTLFNGDGKNYHAHISAIAQSDTTLEVTDIETNDAEPKQWITLFQAMPKGDKADFISQKAVELGLCEVVFFDSEHTVKKFGGKSERFSRIALEAAKQCGRSSVPEIVVGIDFSKMLKMLEAFNLKLFANERERLQSLSDILPQDGLSRHIAIIIGSEGGFSESEAKQLEKSGAKSFTLGRRILRAETAAVAVPAIIMSMLGELK